MKTGKLYWRPFSTGRVVTQGDPVSPAIFNILVDAVVRASLLEVCGPQEAQHGFRWAVGELNISFYAGDGRIAERNPIWVQTELMAMVRIFERVCLQTNPSKTRAMVCTSGFIWGQQVFEAYKQRATVEGLKF